MSARVPLSLAASICGVKRDTIHKWVRDGRINRYPDECTIPQCTGKDYFDVHELLAWIDARDPDALYSRRGMRPDQRLGDTRHVLARVRTA